MHSVDAAIGDGLGVPAVGVPPEQAREEFGSIGVIVALDNPTSSANRQATLDWRPQHPTLLEDLRAGQYFAG